MLILLFANILSYVHCKSFNFKTSNICDVTLLALYVYVCRDSNSNFMESIMFGALNDIILGLPNRTDIINLIILGKLCIWECRKAGIYPDFALFLNKVKIKFRN